MILLTLAVLGGTIFQASRHFRKSIREQIAGRDARVLYALWLSQPFKDALDDGLADMAKTPAGQLEAILEITQLSPLSGYLATRLFDTNGNFVVALPPRVSVSRLSPKELLQLRNFEPVSRFIPAARLPDLSPASSGSDRERTHPLLEITVPLVPKDQKRLLGIAQFVLEGSSIAREFAALDRTLMFEGVVTFLASGAIVVIVLGLAFQQLEKVNRLLLERTQNLLQVNQELTWAAKASAIGAVTSHLIHGLKNPLSGLQNFMVNSGPESPPKSDTEWQLAATTTRRMQSLVNEVVRILREQSDTARYEITIEELAQMMSAKAAPLSQHAGVHFQTQLKAQGTVTNRDANLILLILENLIQNAIQATPKGKTVTLSLESEGGKVICEVRDEGTGLPDNYKNNLFKPCLSTKEHGTGIGLAISKQLAIHIGAELDLKSATVHGCVFTLVVPASLLKTKATERQEIVAK